MAAESSTVELVAAFARLQGLLLDARTADASVAQLAEVIRDLIPLAVGAGVTLIDKYGQPVSLAATDPRVEAVDRMQYELGESPCLSAWDTVTFQRVQDTLTESRWPDWAAAAAATGVRSVLSTPLIYQGREIGAVKVYAGEPEAFTDYEEHLLGLLAGAAATLLGAIQDSHTAYELTTELEDALAARLVIQQAVGVLMGRYDLDTDTAHDRLLRTARQHQAPVLEIAQCLLRHPEDPAAQIPRP